MANPWLKKTPFMSMWLSTANRAAGTAQTQPTQTQMIVIIVNRFMRGLTRSRRSGSILSQTPQGDDYEQ